MFEGDVTGEVRNNTFVNNLRGVGDRGTNMSIRYNNIEGNAEFGVINYDSGAPTVATCNYWGHATGPKHEDNPRKKPRGDRVSNNVEFSPWSVREIRDGEGSCTGGRGRGL